MKSPHKIAADKTGADKTGTDKQILGGARQVDNQGNSATNGVDRDTGDEADSSHQHDNGHAANGG